MDTEHSSAMRARAGESERRATDIKGILESLLGVKGMNEKDYGMIARTKLKIEWKCEGRNE